MSQSDPREDQLPPELARAVEPGAEEPRRGFFATSSMQRTVAWVVLGAMFVVPALAGVVEALTG